MLTWGFYRDRYIELRVQGLGVQRLYGFYDYMRFYRERHIGLTVNFGVCGFRAIAFFFFFFFFCF